MNVVGGIRWTPELEDQLRQLWDVDGFSASEIARIMGLRSRNSVIGKVRRMNLTRRRQQNVAPRPGSRMPGIKARPPKSRVGKDGSIAKRLNAKGWAWNVTPAIIPGDTRRLKSEAWDALQGVLPVSMCDLDPGMCKWPIGESKPFLFCGAHAEGSYCPEHFAMSIGRGTESERDAIRNALKVAACERCFICDGVIHAKNTYAQPNAKSDLLKEELMAAV